MKDVFLRVVLWWLVAFITIFLAAGLVGIFKLIEGA
jgi:hypothetical protein